MRSAHQKERHLDLHSGSKLDGRSEEYLDSLKVIQSVLKKERHWDLQLDGW